MHVRSFDVNPAQDRDKKRGRDERDGEGDAGVVGKCVANVSWQMCVCVCVRVCVCLSVRVCVCVCLFVCVRCRAAEDYRRNCARHCRVHFVFPLAVSNARTHAHMLTHAFCTLQRHADVKKETQLSGGGGLEGMARRMEQERHQERHAKP